MTITYNNKKILELLLLFSLLTSFIGKAQDFIWAASTNYEAGYGYNDIRSIVTDSQGNIYSTGYFGGTVDFNPSTNNFNLTAFPPSVGYTNGFILKLDKDKNFLWVKQIKSNWVDGGKSIILDKDENIIVTGLATGLQIDLNPDEGGQYIINNPTGNTGSYVIKLDSDGNFIFGNYYAGAYADESTIDHNNNIITTGVVTRTNVDFDAGSGIYNLNNTSDDIFILKNNSNGAFIWAKNIGGNRYDYPISLVCDNLNNIILKGNFESNIKFSNINYTSDYNCNFICKMAPDGQDIWLLQLGLISGGISNEDKSVKTDSSNNIYFNTVYSSFLRPFTPNFNNVNLSFTSDRIDSILFKVNQNGEYIWHNSIYGSERQETYSLDFDNYENIYLIAYVTGATFINNNCNQVFPNKNTFSSNEGLLLKFDQAGNFINFKNIVGGGFSLNCDFQNNILIGGSFGGQLDFDPSPISSFLINSSYSDGFNLKLAICTSATPEGDPTQLFCYNNSPTVADLQPCSAIVDWYDSVNSNTPIQKESSLIDQHIYYAAYHESCEGTTRLAVTANINSYINVPYIINSTFCKNDNPILSNITVIGNNIKWYDSSNGADLLSNATLLESNRVYFVSQTQNGCESSRVPVIPDLKDYSLTLNSNLQTFCIQETATINAIEINGQNIKWYDALTNGNLLANATSLQNGTTYYASQTINGCESDRIPVLINIQNTAAPTASANQTFCSSQNPTLNTIVISGTAIQWYNNIGNLLSNATPLQDGVTYYATQTENGCESPTKLAISISLINTLPANDYTELFCDDLNDGSEKVNLSDYNSKLISNTSGYNFSYYSTISAAENESVSNQITNFSNFNLVLGDNKIYVRINSNTPCYAIAVLKLSVVAKPLIPIPDIVPICENNTISINAGSATDSFSWSTGETTPSIIIANPGEYAVTVTKNYGPISCSSSKKFSVVKSTIATITSIDTQDWTDKNNVISVYVDGAGSYEYSVDGIRYQDSNEFQNLISGAYTVYVKDKNGCGIVTDKVYLLMYPKFFTPNGDGYNDTWSIHFSDTEVGLSVQLFDRYGKLITVLNRNQTWDGTFNGHELPSTDYWFIVTRADGKVYKGHFTLKR